MALVQYPSNLVSKSIYPSGQTGLTGVASTLTLNGPTVPSKYLGDCVAARVKSNLFTNGLQILARWQVLDDDGATWVDALESFNPARVALNTGAGTSGGTSYTAFVSAPPSVMAGNRPARLTVYGAGSGPANSSFDSASIAYDFRSPISPYNG